LLENGKSGVDHKLIQATIGTLSVAIRNVMKPDTNAHRTPFRSKDTHTSSGFTNPSKAACILNRHRLVEVQETAVDVCKGMHFAAVCEIELQTKRSESRTVCSFATKD